MRTFIHAVVALSAAISLSACSREEEVSGMSADEAAADASANADAEAEAMQNPVTPPTTSEKEGAATDGAKKAKS